MNTNKYIRVIAMALLFAMFHYVAGYRLMYSLGILYTKQEAKECISEKNENVKKFNFSASDYKSLKWTEKNTEFSFNNEMYDVVSIQKSGTRYDVTAYSDDPETELITAFHNFEQELTHPDQSAKSAENIMTSFQKDYTPSSAFKISMYAPTEFQYPAVITQQHLLKLPDSIWHPPAIC